MNSKSSVLESRKEKRKIAVEKADEGPQPKRQAFQHQEKEMRSAKKKPLHEYHPSRGRCMWLTNQHAIAERQADDKQCPKCGVWFYALETRLQHRGPGTAGGKSASIQTMANIATMIAQSPIAPLNQGHPQHVDGWCTPNTGHRRWLVWAWAFFTPKRTPKLVFRPVVLRKRCYFLVKVASIDSASNARSFAQRKSAIRTRFQGVQNGCPL
eukprot:TRINITY_DN1737_c0_g1_i1.p1 TRINITY_DN1737_c0_g1~~TRINITY_DN1737_c0_g1_i1.p1  ORF type:complete len:211 (-),score=13.71 TRINITY_DN1737_c0_g1_i1:48-680(-)